MDVRTLAVGTLLSTVLGVGLVAGTPTGTPTETPTGTPNAEPGRSVSVQDVGATGRRIGRTTDRNLGLGGQCTYGAYARFHAATGLWPLITGDAADWNDTAPGWGWSVVSRPASRAIVVFERGTHGASPTYGHVGWVEAVAGDQIRIVEMNGTAGEWRWSRRTITHGPGMSYILAP